MADLKLFLGHLNAARGAIAGRAASHAEVAFARRTVNEALEHIGKYGQGYGAARPVPELAARLANDASAQLGSILLKHSYGSSISADGAAVQRAAETMSQAIRHAT